MCISYFQCISIWPATSKCSMASWGQRALCQAAYSQITSEVLFSFNIIRSKICISLKKQDFPGGSDGKESAWNAGNPGWIPESGIIPGEGDGYPLQHSCLENPMDIGAWRVTAVYGVAKESDMTDWLTHTHTQKKKKKHKKYLHSPGSN